jgi:hypothetical protein
MTALGVIAFGAVFGWWAVSVVGWRRPGVRAFSAVAVAAAAAGWIVAALTQPGRVAQFAVAVFGSACVHTAFLGALAWSGRGTRGARA